MNNNVDLVKQKTDIVDVISQYVKLQKSGHNFKANCPFHSEKSPSFFVFPEKQTWHCFGGCASGGDVIAFVMKKESIDFVEALHLLADKAGIQIETKRSTPEEKEQYDRLYKVNEVATEFYHFMLLHSDEAIQVREYVNQRKLDSKTMISFLIGYSPNRWNDLSNHLIKNGYTEKEMLDAGLIVMKDSGGYYDRFRNRIMFPIHDIKNRVVGFGGRALGDAMPKYLNSPQTMIFDKSSIVYGIDKAYSNIREKDAVVIVEGFMDTLTAHQNGFNNTVACMGTALTEKQISIIRRYSRNIIIAMDSDSAGLQSTERSMETISKTATIDQWTDWSKSKTYHELLKNEIQVVEIIGGKDPDEIINQSTEKWQELLHNSQPIIDFTIKKALGLIDLTNSKDVSNFVSKFIPVLSTIDDPVRCAHYIQKLSHALKIDERALNDALYRYKSGNKINTARIENIYKPIKARYIEEYCLGLLLNFPNLRPIGSTIELNYFEYSENRNIFTKWLSCEDDLHHIIDPMMYDYLNSIIAFKDKFPQSMFDNKKESELVLDDCINRLQERYIKEIEIKKKILLTDDPSNQIAILKEHGTESHQLKDIFKKRSRYFSHIKS